jgi:hypothetical protein
MTIYVLIAEHQTVAGVILKAFTTDAKARQEAAGLANIMLADADRAPTATASNYEEAIAPLQDEYGAAHCHITITAIPLEA